MLGILVIYTVSLQYSDRLHRASATLAPYAVPLDRRDGRVIDEQSDPTRFPFQRDRDRIIHTQAFRRLQGKTQVFVLGEGDHYRTRLTHTMEVAQIGRDMARTLSVNEDLAECIALAHDLGHPPFGHSGEEALDVWMQQFGKRFEHNAQSLRLVTTLERRSSLYKGLNLNKEVLDGLQKHSTPHDSPEPAVHHCPTLEAQVVNIADEIAYTGHDCDDALRAKIIHIDDLITVPLAARAYSQAKKNGTFVRGALIHLLVMDLYTETQRRIADASIESLDDVLAFDTPLVGFSDSVRSELDALRSFLWSNVYMHPQVHKKAEEGKRVVTELCTRLHAHPTEKVTALHEKFGGALEEAIKDYVAGMTDQYAMLQTGEIR